MNTVGKAKAMRGTRNGRHRPVRWFSMLMAASVLAVSGAVVADVVLTYIASSRINDATSDFGFQNGANYAQATAYGVASNLCSSGGAYAACPNSGAVTAGYTIQTTLHAPPLVGVNLYDVSEFIDLTAVATTGKIVVGSANAPGAIAGVACAYAFITVSLPTIGAVATPAGCYGTEPAPAATASASCPNAATSNGVTIVDLQLGTVTTRAGGAICAFNNPSIVGTMFWISYAVYTTANLGAVPLNLAQITLSVTSP